MSERIINSLIQAVPPTLMALAAVIVALKGLQQGKSNGAKADAAEIAAVEAKNIAAVSVVKADRLAEKADLIHEVSIDTRRMANGNLSEVNSELKALHEKYEDLQKTVTGGGSDTVMAELNRIATNVHRLANAITPLLGQDLQLIPRPIPKDPSGD